MGFGYNERGFVMPRYKTVTASGNPLTLQNAKRLRKLTICGNAVQNGTPSPDAPVEVQLCGDRTGNLCPVSKGIEGTTNFSLETPVVEGETYTFSFVADSVSEGHTGVGMHLKLGSLTGTAQISGVTCPIGNRYVRSFTATGSGTLFINGYWTQSFSQIQVLKGSYTAETLPAYEPYGYKVSGRAEGLNLLDYDVFEAGAISGSTGTDLDNSLSIRTGTYIEICPNTRYHISFAESLYLRIIFYASDKSFISQIYVASGSYSFTTPDQTFFIRLSLQGINNRLEPSSIQAMLVQGSYTAETMLPYEPYQPPQDFAVYLPEQIAKVGDVADTVVLDMEKRTATLVQNIRRLDFTGEEKRGREVKAKNRFYLNASLGLPASRQPAISNRFVTANLSSPQHHDDLTTFAHDNSIYIYYAAMDTTDDFKAFLAANPTYAYVQYATPVTTDITAMQDWDAMPQVKGTVTLTLSAEVPPSGAEAVYISSRSPKPKAQTIPDVVINEADPEHTEASEQEQADEAAALNIEMITYE